MPIEILELENFHQRVDADRAEQEHQQRGFIAAGDNTVVHHHHVQRGGDGQQTGDDADESRAPDIGRLPPDHSVEQ